VFVFLAAVIVAFALSLGLVPLERNINAMRRRIAKMSKPNGEEPTKGHDLLELNLQRRARPQWRHSRRAGGGSETMSAFQGKANVARTFSNICL
jgi:hypothetical protein